MQVLSHFSDMKNKKEKGNIFPAGIVKLRGHKTSLDWHKKNTFIESTYQLQKTSEN